MSGEKTKLQIHPEYLASRKTLQGIEDFTDGKLEKVLQYLIRYETEDEATAEGRAAFTGRRARAYNENQCRPYLEIHLAHMAQDIQFLGMEGESWETILEDVTQLEDPAKEFARKINWHYCRDGRVGVLVDRERSIGETRADAAAAGERSYQVMYPAKDILNWARFTKGPNKGKLSDLLLCDGWIKDDGKDYQLFRRIQMTEEGIVTVTRYRAGPFAGDWLGEFEAESLEAPITIGITGLIPFVLIGAGVSDSLLSDVWEPNRALFNRLSVRDNVNYNQGFQKHILIGAQKEEIQRMSEWLVTLISNEKASVQTIPAGDPTALTEVIREIRHFIRRVAMFEFNQLADDSKESPSAESKEKDTKARKELYDSILDLLEKKLTQVYQLMAMFEGASDAELKDIKVQIAREYGLDDKVQQAAERQQAFSMASSLNVPEVKKELLKGAIEKLRLVATEDDDEEDVRQQLYEAIDKAEEAPRFALPGTGTTPAGRPALGSLLSGASNGAATQ